MGRLFGTDGIRGLANEDLTAELALSVAEASVAVLASRGSGGLGGLGGPARRERPLVVIGRDTRPSGEFLEAAVVAGLAASGADVIRLGVVPTPTVAFTVADSAADFGVVLSASHNPMPDNGIKLFGRGGHKLADAVEDRIEAVMAGPARLPAPTGAAIGRVSDDDVRLEHYLQHLVATLPASLDGLKVVVDCAQGAASRLAPEALRRAGADVIAIFADADGLRINEGCGATATEALQRAVVEHGADVGIAHDGDADRCLAVDASGTLVDGDQILAVCALALHERGQLAAETVVATVMSNLGFHHAMRDAGVTVRETPVGDRYVLEAMRQSGYVLGGEQSGHVVFLDHATTGDGLLTALQLLGQVAASGRTLAELCSVVHRLPQVLVNVRTRREAASEPLVQRAVAAAAQRLGDHGRVLLRPSGTEPLVRVMVEAPTQSEARAVAEELAGVVAEHGGELGS